MSNNMFEKLFFFFKKIETKNFEMISKTSRVSKNKFTKLKNWEKL